MAKGTAKKLKGSVKEALGKVNGDRQLETEGLAEKIEGSAEEQSLHKKNGHRPNGHRPKDS